MALAAIRKRLNDSDAFDLLGLLISPDSMRWVHEPDGTPTSALIIGKDHGRYVTAFLSRKRVAPDAPAPKLRFAIGSRDAGTYELKTAEDLPKLSLMSPFKYVKGYSKSEKWRVSMLIKYYFLMTNKLDGSAFDGFDLDNMSKKFEQLLLVIKEEKAGEKKCGGKEKQVIEESEEDEEEEKEDDDSSVEGVKTRSSYERTRSPRPSPRKSIGSTDYDRLKDTLRSHNELHLLENIPTAGEMTFKDQNLISAALEKKLFVGRVHSRRDDIYAYMRHAGSFHEIRFQCEGRNGAHHLSCEAFMRQQVIHPFNKTFPKGGSKNPEDNARVTLMVKWYFIEAGIAKNVVLKETQRFPDRFRKALQMIAQRMGHAAKPSEPRSPPEIDESDIQSRLDLQVSPTSPPRRPSTARRQMIHQEPTPSNDSASPIERTQKRKRTAEDAGLESLERNIAKDRALTRELNEIDDRLELHELQGAALKRERDELNEKRKGVRRELKRDSLAFATSTDHS
jgi:hypothetical protein